MTSENAPKTFLDELKELVAAGTPDGQVTNVEHHETHLSHVLLAGDKAYKLKKAVSMPFVDFSTPEKRHKACLAEVEINERLGSPLYDGVSTLVRRRDGGMEFDGEGTPVDSVVIMRRFDSTMQFDELARAGKIGDGLARQTADRIAQMHAGLAPVTTAGHTADYRKVIRDLRKTEADGAAKFDLDVGEPAPFGALDAELSRIDPLLERRRTRGMVRRTHGDLHLRNICLFQGEPVPFDALEFDERLATTDVLYDLAFLLMDLRQEGQKRLANIIMNRYWDSAREDEDALRLLPFFMALRATVRMAVAVETGALEQAQAYRLLAFTLLEHHDPVLVAVGGLSGTGKSTVAASLAPELTGPAGARLLRSDVLRKQTMAQSPEAGKADPDAYAPENRARTYRDLAGHASSALAAGASVIADATFQQSSARDAIADIARPHAYAFWLEAPLETRLARVSGRQSDASDADVTVARQQDEPCDLGAQWQRIDASGSVDSCLEQILHRITAPAGHSHGSRMTGDP